MTPQIRKFLQSAQIRFNKQLLCLVSDSIFPATMVLALIWAIAWRLFGYAAPTFGYFVAILLGFIALIIWFFWKKPNLDLTAQKTDRHFSLKESLVSYLDFQHRDTSHPAFVLQEKTTLQRIEDCDLSTIPTKLNRRRLTIAAILSIAVVSLAMLPHSDAIQQKLLEEQVMLERTRLLQEEVNKMVEEMISSMSEQEKQLVKPEILRQWAKEIGRTKNREEAMKRMAKFEQNVGTALAGIESRKDDEILKLAAAELAESQMADAKQLGKKLENKDFNAAKQQLGELNPKQEHKNLTPEELKRLQENIEKLKEMTRRMAEGAKRRDFKSSRLNKNLKLDLSEMELDELLEMLDENTQEIDPEDLEEMDDSEDLDELDESLEMLELRLGKADARDKMREKMKMLGKAAGKGQMFLNGKLQQLGLAAKPPGKGHIESKRDKKDEFKDNNNYDRLTGKKGEGPSRSTIEEANSGSGASGRSTEEKQREFRRQAEALVQRDDVPDELKQGIREYFERVHEIPEETK